MREKNFKRVKVICFAFWWFFYAENLFIKKIIEIVLIASFTILLKILITV